SATAASAAAATNAGTPEFTFS
ncbi:hypothetical protein A2U01_0100637, partial [Trifolium medium]|nr:hypothetical protein [Trifolium medium]